MTAKEFAEWQAFFSAEPFTARRLDYAAALIAATVANANRKPKTKARPVKDFVVDWWKEPRPEASPSSMMAFAAELTRAMGGTVGPDVQAVIDRERSREADGGPGPG